MLKFNENKNILKLKKFLKNPENKIVNEKYEEVCNHIANFFEDSNNEKEIKKFVNNIVGKYSSEIFRIKHIVDKFNSSEANDVSKQLNTLNDDNECNSSLSNEVAQFYIKTLDDLPISFLKLLQDLIKIYNWIEFKETCDDTFNDYLEYDITTTDGKYKNKIFSFISESYIDMINNKIFKPIINGGEKKKIVSVLIGRTGVGKSTLANIFEGYYCTLDGSNLKKRKIGHHGRGSNDFEMITIPIGNIEIVLIDTIGTCDADNNYTFSKIWSQLTSFLIKNNLIVDIFLYMIDGSIERMDKGEVDTLENFITCMKVVHNNNLDYWKKIILVMSKGNKIKVDNIEGIPKYKYKSFIKKKKLKDNNVSIEKYNQVYFGLIKNVIVDYEKKIKDRIYLKISDVRTSKTDSESDDQSFLNSFKLIIKKHFTRLSDQEIERLIGIIDINKVLIGNSEKQDDDFKECRILPIPDFDNKINCGGLFNYDDPSYIMRRDSNLYTENWFSDLYKRIMITSSSPEFKLTIANLNEIKKFNDDLSKQRSNMTYEMDDDIKEEINRNAAIILESQPTILENIGTFFKNIWNSIVSLFI
jgi:hypothetical protein